MGADEQFFSTGDMARHLGMSPQGLRWYESKGLVSPAKDNTYRRYSIDDFCLLSRVRYYHRSGFSIEEINELLDADLDGMADSMDALVEVSLKEIETKKAKLSLLENRATALREFLVNKKSFSETFLDTFYFMPSVPFVGEGAHISNETVKRWAGSLPFAQYMSLYDYSCDADEPGLKIGISLPQRFLPYVDGPVHADIENGYAQVIQGSRALHGVISLSETDSSIEKFSGKDFLESRQGLGKTVIRRPLTCRRENGKAISYWEVWAPFADGR